MWEVVGGIVGEWMVGRGGVGEEVLDGGEGRDGFEVWGVWERDF